MVFDGGGDDVVALLPVRVGHPLDREIVALRAAAGEDDLRRVGPEKCEAILFRASSTAERRLLAEGVEAGRIAVDLPEVGQHRLDHPGPGVVDA